MTTALKTWTLIMRSWHLAQLQVCFARLLALHDEIHVLQPPGVACVHSLWYSSSVSHEQ